MNKRIQEIIEECGIVHEYQTVGERNDMLRRYEKLVELIVKECVAVCLSQRDPASLNYKPSEKYAEAVKQHFGVE